MGMRRVSTNGARPSTSKVLFSIISFTCSNLSSITRDSIAIGVEWVTEYNTGTGMDSRPGNPGTASAMGTHGH